MIEHSLRLAGGAAPHLYLDVSGDVGLAGEVVVEGTPRGTGLLDDVVDSAHPVSPGSKDSGRGGLEALLGATGLGERVDPC